MSPIYPGQLPHLLLTMACAEPLTGRDLFTRVEARYGAQKGDPKRGAWACRKLSGDGLLRRAGRTVIGHGVHSLFVLTAAGEDVLDALDYDLWLWRQRRAG